MLTLRAQGILAALGLGLLLASIPLLARSATLLPNGEQTFVDANGIPLSGGTVQFDVPNTSTPKTTWVDPAQAVANANPVVLDSAGRAIIYGSGSYRQIVKDQFGNLVWDQLTADTSGANAVWGGTATGTANAPVLTASTFVGGTGQQLNWINASTNTGAVSITVNGVAYAVDKDTPSGPVALTGGELAATDVAQALYDGTVLHLVTSNLGGQLTTLASGTTTDLGTVPSHNVSVTGTAAITAFGSSANANYPIYDLIFTGAATLTYNASSLILPTSANIVTAAGDTAVAAYSGSGNWVIRSYSRASGQPITTNNYQVFTTSGTWTKPSPVTAASTTAVQCWGAGGADSALSNDGQGGGGGYQSFTFLTSALSATVTVTIPGATASGAGGNATFGSYLTAYGGGAGSTGNPGGGGGGGGTLSVGGGGSGASPGNGGGPAGGVGSSTIVGGDGATGGAAGGGGTSGFTGGNSTFGGGGGAGNGSTTHHGGNSVYGGGGGGGSGAGMGGTSMFGGNGADSTVAATAPGGGGGYINSAGARGECRVKVTN